MPTTEPDRYTAANGVPTAAALAESTFMALANWSSVTSSLSMLWSCTMAATARSISPSVTCNRPRYFCRKANCSIDVPPVQKNRLIKSLVREICTDLICPAGHWLSIRLSKSSRGVTSPLAVM
ncbi:hypothetical protein D3C79_778950 [compost metagenome]